MSRNLEYMKLINTWRWQKLRTAQLSDTPLCERCRSEGRLTPATQVHHVVPVESTHDPVAMKNLAYDRANLMSVCEACHKAIHEELRQMQTVRRTNWKQNKELKRKHLDEYLARVKAKFMDSHL